MPLEHQRQMRQFVASYGVHLGDAVLESLRSIPKGWFNVVRGMLDRVEQILCDSEQRTFRWIKLARQDEHLAVQWSGAESSDDLIDQIVEETLGEARNTCVDCGASTLLGRWDTDGPRCLFHASVRSGYGRIKEWNLSALELMRALQGGFGSTLPTRLNPKTAAAALPLLIREAAAYFREPDQDATEISQQLREALNWLERRSTDIRIKQ